MPYDPLVVNLKNEDENHLMRKVVGIIVVAVVVVAVILGVIFCVRYTRVKRGLRD